MPPVFKTLASITVWILFINGCIAIIASPIVRIATGEVLGPMAAWAIGVTSLILAVVAMKLRQTLE